MKERHVDDPQWIGEALHPLAGVPDQAVAMDQVVGIAHRDHGIVEQHVISCAVDNEAAGQNISPGIIEEADDRQAEEQVAQEF